MSKLNREMLRMVLTLFVLAVVAATLLGVVHMLTEVDEGEALRKKIAEAYESPIATELDVQGYLNNKDAEVLSAFAAEDGAIIVLSKSKRAYSGNGLQLLVIFLDGKLTKIATFKNEETPGLGSKALQDSYFAQYVGLDTAVYDAAAFENSADDFGVSALSGATKTSNGVLISVNNAIKFYKELQDE